MARRIAAAREEKRRQDVIFEETIRAQEEIMRLVETEFEAFEKRHKNVHDALKESLGELPLRIKRSCQS